MTHWDIVIGQGMNVACFPHLLLTQLIGPPHFRYPRNLRLTHANPGPPLDGLYQAAAAVVSA